MYKPNCGAFSEASLGATCDPDPGTCDSEPTSSLADPGAPWLDPGATLTWRNLLSDWISDRIRIGVPRFAPGVLKVEDPRDEGVP